MENTDDRHRTGSDQTQRQGNGELLIGEPAELVDHELDSMAENRFQGTISSITKGKIMTEYVVRLDDGTELCSVVTRKSGERLGLQKGDPIYR